MKKADFRWFVGGKLNAADNCVDKNAERHPDRLALLWERDEPSQHEEVTYGQLAELTAKTANAFKRAGVKKGDVVALYAPPSPYAVAAMLACARIGAVHTVIFAGFSAEAIATRIRDSGAVAVVVADVAVRGGKRIDLKVKVNSDVDLCDLLAPIVHDGFGSERLS